MKINPKIEKSRLKALSEEFDKDYFKKIKETIINDINSKEILYPPMDLIFNAFNKTPFDKVKVVIIGQDPYHGKGQAHGLCFSVPENIKQPPSLKNIFKEIKDDLGIDMKETGFLEKWTKEGVLLLNAILTVKAGKPASHSKIGWEIFTNGVIKTISDKKSGIVFLLWGNYAKSKKVLIDTSKHYILEAAHPSPFSANNGFFGCRHFSKTNEILRSLGKKEIDWKI